MADTVRPGRIETIRFDDGADLACYRSPAQGKRIGGLVLIQEIFGLTAHIRDQCDRFAAAGFEVLAPAIFDRQAPALELGYGDADIAEAIRLVRAHPIDRAVADALHCACLLAPDGPVFMTGYCYGGSVTWLSVTEAPVCSAAACFYGAMLPSKATLVPLCPTMAHFGDKDAEIPIADVRAFSAQRPDVDVLLYPARHGFASDRRADYHAESALLSFGRTVEHFRGNA